ncbi:MAG: hypothetical protein WCS42_16290 [Verrucomicrobiota bacterium]
MSQADAPAQWREPFPETEIPHILAAILRCATGLGKKHDREHENHLTIRLAKRLLKDQAILGRPIHLDWEVWEIDFEKAELLGRLDLRYLYSTGTRHPWPCFTLEAKRLHVTFPKGGWKSLVSEYVTMETDKPAAEEQGMMCFVTGRYAGGLLCGAMVGYVYDGQVEDARKAIEQAIIKHAAKLKLAQPFKLQISKLFQDESRIAESVHELSAGKFTIYHVLFGV